ncbi:MAG: flippase-like domain-containing protein [Pseudonocardiaceae bacterium]|nr:flippase-like domain-containing protein [Pseudonocardiaceae bacterium]
MKIAARVVGAIAVLVVAFLTLRGRIPSPAEVRSALEAADARWLLLAAAAEFVSLGMFARLQRRLLNAFGVHLPLPRSLALAYSRAAITFSMPAGSAVSAAYAFRQFRLGGANRSAAATVLVLAGLVSTGALALLYGTGVLTTGVLELSAASDIHPAVIALATLAVLVAITLVIRRLVRSRKAAGPAAADPAPEPQPERPAHQWPSRWPRVTNAMRELTDALRGSRSVPYRHWGLALGAATTNWLTDLLCLAAAARAFDLPLDLVQLGTIYLTVQIVRQVPLTPGGIGVIEASLLTGLVSAGAAESPAAAAVLAYRLLSCWLIIPVGLLAFAVLRRGQRGAQPSATPRSVPRVRPAAHLRGTRRGPRRVPHRRSPTEARV